MIIFLETTRNHNNVKNIDIELSLLPVFTRTFLLYIYLMTSKLEWLEFRNIDIGCRYKCSKAASESGGVPTRDARAARRAEAAQVPLPVPGADRARGCYITGIDRSSSQTEACSPGLLCIPMKILLTAQIA